MTMIFVPLGWTLGLAGLSEALKVCITSGLKLRNMAKLIFWHNVDHFRAITLFSIKVCCFWVLVRLFGFLGCHTRDLGELVSYRIL